jgi:hypothetical protein
MARSNSHPLRWEHRTTQLHLLAHPAARLVRAHIDRFLASWRGFSGTATTAATFELLGVDDVACVCVFLFVI